MNKEIVRHDESGTSNVTTYVKEEKKTYVRRYAMSSGARRVWLENNRAGEENDIMFPSKKEAARAEETTDGRDKAKILIFSLCAAALLTIISVFAYLFVSRLLIGEVTVEGSTLYAGEELLASGGLSISSKLPLFGRDEIEKELLAKYPYIKSCEIKIELPNKLMFLITEENAAVYTEAFGEYYALSRDLKVLERSKSKETFSHLLYIKVPSIKQALVGEKMIFADDMKGDYIIDFLDLLEDSDMSGRLGTVYFDKKYDIVASADGKYRIHFGSPAEISLKLKTASHIIKQNDESCQTGSVIDVRVVDIAGIVINADIDPEARE